MPSRSLRLILPLLGLLFACNSDTTAPRDAGSEVDADDAQGPITGHLGDAAQPANDAALPSIDASADAQVDTGGDAAPDTATACVAKGCDELGFECGTAIDNCGNPLNCNNLDNTSPCELPLRCGGDPDKGANKCGCKARADACAAQGAQCGAIDECGVPVQCGECSGGRICLSNLCSCTPNSNPCGAKTCGMASDGCGNMVACGSNNGACSVGTCSAEGACGCRPREQACEGKTGAVTESGCSYNCDAACVPDNAAACAGAECGTATNNCGEVVSCGAAAGACGTGNSCVGPQFITDNALPARSAAYQGGYCVPSNVAKLIGKYAARAHGFRQAGASGLNLINRAEAVSLISMTYERGTQRTRMKDIGCVATTISAPGSFPSARAVIPDYRKLDPVDVDITVTGDRWARGDVPHTVLGLGLPIGFTVGLPDFCVGYEGLTVDLPASDPRRGKYWADNRCLCPTTANANKVPVETFETTVSRDCRVVDADGDGKPGFTARANALVVTTDMYNVNVSHGVWSGVIRDDRFHIGAIGEAVQPMERAVVGCSAKNALCAPASTDCGCAEDKQPIQFVPLADDAPLSCDIYYKADPDPFKIVKQADLDSQFGVAYGSCTGAGQCSAGAICHNGQCMVMTSKGACSGATNGPCPGDQSSKFCEMCPAGMECKSDGACWPTAAACPPPPANQRVGDLCLDP